MDEGSRRQGAAAGAEKQHEGARGETCDNGISIIIIIIIIIIFIIIIISISIIIIYLYSLISWVCS